MKGPFISESGQDTVLSGRSTHHVACSSVENLHVLFFNSSTTRFVVESVVKAIANAQVAQGIGVSLRSITRHAVIPSRAVACQQGGRSVMGLLLDQLKDNRKT